MDNELQGEFVLHSSPHHAKPKLESSEKPKKLNRMHFYSAFTHNPKGFSLADEEEGEEIVLVVRKHFVTNFPWILLAFILSILPFFSSFVTSSIPFLNFSTQTQALIVVFYYLFIFGFLLLNFTLWFYHIGIITNLRVFDIDLAGILYRHNSVSKHENIEDVTYSQVGFFSSLFNYGDVHVQTAGTNINIEYDKVPQPAKVAKILAEFAKSV